MALEHVMGLVDQILEDPLKSRMRSLFAGLQSPTMFPCFGDFHCCTGDVLEIGQHWIDAAMYRFVPGEGFVSNGDDDGLVRLHVQDIAARSIHLVKGVQIVCAGNLRRLKDMKEAWFENAAISFRPELLLEMPWSALHFYAGSFAGWGQALNWLSKTQPFVLKGQELAVDHDDTVMQLWSVKHGAQVLRAPISFRTAWTPSECVGICGGVEDYTLLNVLRAQLNLVLTMSPPCQSWSRGGKSTGLYDVNGYSFVHALCTAAACQPNFIAAECADELVNHPHWPLLKALAQSLGFKLVWTQATPYHAVVGHYRTRWLGVWIRADHRCQAFAFTLKPTIVPRLPWDHQGHELRVPQIWSDQLRLSPSECEFYNREDLLPQAKRAKVANPGPPHENKGLWSRVLDSSDPMPTLCASYSRQHLLSEGHLQNKGIFAVLQHTSDGFRFFPPGMFVSMFGAVEHQVLPTKLQATFQVVGNAITVPQSVLALTIGFLSLTGDPIDPLKLLRQAWADRITAWNSVTFQQGDYVHIVPKDSLRPWLCPVPEQACPFSHVKCCGKVGDVTFEQRLPLATRGSDIFRAIFQGPHDLVSQFQLVNHDVKSHSGQSIEVLAHAESDWQIYAHYCAVGQCHLTFDTPPRVSTEVIDISPTLPYELDAKAIEGDNHDPSWEQFVGSNLFRVVQPIIETLQDDAVARACEVIVVEQSAQIAIAIHCTAQDQQRCVQQIQNAFQGRTSTLPQSKGVVVAILNPSTPAGYTTLMTFCKDNFFGTVKILEISSHINSSGAIEFDGIPLAIQQVNGQHVQHCTMLARGDFLCCVPKQVVVAGGHHQFIGPPPILRQGSDFEARIEFMTNTHGWAASDEIYAHTQTLMWMGAGIRASPPVMWDISKDHFDDAYFGDPIIYNNAVTLLPILVRSHWGAAEITKQGEVTTVTLVQIHSDFHQPILAILARLMDITPDRITMHATPEHYQPHLCGWNLLMRWFSRGGHHNQLDDVAAQFHLPQHLFDAVCVALQCSIEDWRTAGITREVELFAHRLRQNFLTTLAVNHAQGRPPQQPMLQVCHPSSSSAITVLTPTLAPVTPEQDRLDRVQQRLDHFREFSGWLGTDEMDYTLEGPRLLSLSTLFCAPAVWSIQQGQLSFINDLTPEYATFGHIIWPIVVQNHWIMVEYFLSGGDVHFSATVPTNLREQLRALFDHLVHVTETDRTRLRFVFLDQVSPQNMCGYHILQQLFNRVDAGQVSLSEVQRQRLATSQWAQSIALVQDEAQVVWDASPANPTLRHFAAATRDWFLLRVIENRFPSEFIAAGAQDDDVTMIEDPSKKAKTSAPIGGAKSAAAAAPAKDSADPWSTWDPWKPKPPRPQQAKWEDLQIRPPLPFIGSDGKPLPQTHRLQLTPTRGGVVFTTKSNLNDVIKANVQGDLVAVLPAGDRLMLKHIAEKMEGPFELAVDDPQAKLSYKRIINMLVIKGSASFKLPDPDVRLTTAAICELVLEVDARLVPRHDFDRFRANPIHTYKSLLAEISSEVAEHAFRMIRYPGGTQPDQMMQVIAKLPFAQRSTILESSGSSVLLTRDFLERGKGSADTTVLPRFWPPSSVELQNMRIAVQGVQGFAGAVMTKRGLAPRIWVTHISAARSHLLASDSRLNKDNLHVVPKITLQLAGWPAATAAEHVVSSTLQALKLAVIPLRTFRVGGVHVWLVTTEAMPNQTRFAVQINSEISEILVQEAPEPSASKGGKGGQKGKVRSKSR